MAALSLQPEAIHIAPQTGDRTRSGPARVSPGKWRRSGV